MLFIGYGLRKVFPPLARYNLPAPVIGGLLIAVLALVARGSGVTLVQFDTTLQTPLMIAFFTSVGFAASVSLLKRGSPLVLTFLVVATLFAVLQNVIGLLLAVAFGLDPLFGVLVGSVTLTGGPATGLAFAPAFEQAGVVGAPSIAVAAAMGGIVGGGIVGGPVATFLIRRHSLRAAPRDSAVVPAAQHTRLGAGELVEESTDGSIEPAGASRRRRAACAARPARTAACAAAAPAKLPAESKSGDGPTDDATAGIPAHRGRDGESTARRRHRPARTRARKQEQQRPAGQRHGADEHPTRVRTPPRRQPVRRPANRVATTRNVSTSGGEDSRATRSRQTPHS